MARRSATLLGVDDYDNPETIRFKKYATGGSEDKKMLILNAGHMSLMARKNPGRASATGCGHAQGKRHPSFTQTASIFPAGTAILGSAANAAVDRRTYLGALRRNTGPVSVSGRVANGPFRQGLLHTSVHLRTDILRSVPGGCRVNDRPLNSRGRSASSCRLVYMGRGTQIVRILITVSPRMYREALALSVHNHRPDLEVRIAPPEEAKAETGSFEPHLLVRNGLRPRPSRSRVPPGSTERGGRFLTSGPYASFSL